MPSPSSPLTRFDPFTNRLCHDIRNGLSDAFMAALDSLSDRPCREKAAALRQNELPEVCRRYISERLRRYGRIISELQRSSDLHPIEKAALLWNQGLFFEVHDLLEREWLTATGTEKEILQALIRAAGVYIHLEHGNNRGAEKMAARAHAVLSRHQQAIVRIRNLDQLLEKLAAVNPEPPVLVIGQGKQRPPGSRR